MFTSALRAYLTRSFKPFRFKGKYTESLIFTQSDDLGLYVHIPFCRSLCSFCPYCKVIHEPKLAQKYVQALLNEIALVGKSLKTKRTTTSLYFGGGTPALLTDDLKSIIGKLKEYFIITKGIGIELHPDDITEENLKKLKNAGISMVSLGIQSFDQNCLSKLGRKRRDFTQKLELVRQAGFDVVDVDLIFAIPGQTDKTLVEDVDTAFRYGATQVSTYPFIDFTFADNQYKPLPERNKKQMLQSLAAHCRNTGKERTSVWTFANPGTEKYSSITRDNFLGFGVSAATLLQDSFKINTFSIEAYIERVESEKLPTSLTLDFTKCQRGVYFLFWNAYSMNISPDQFEVIVGVPLRKMFGFELLVLEKMGLIYREKGQYRLTDKAAYYYHYIEQAYTTAYIDKMWNISRKVPFPEEIVLR